MKAKLTTLLKAIAIVLSIYIFALLIGVLTRWSYYLHLSVVLICIIVAICYFYRTMRPKKKYYFVSYSHIEGFGCCTFAINDGIFRIKEVCEHISKSYFGGVEKIIILYYKNLSKEEYYEQKKGGKE